jgi:hypothetical protein
MTKRFFLALLFPVLLVSCATPTVFNEGRGVGARDAQGQATGKWKIYSTLDSSLVAVGSLSEGRLVGKWDYYISNGTRVAEIRFKETQPNKGCWYGPYRLYYTGLDARGREGDPAKGKLKTIGEAKDGFGDGHFIRYSHAGTVVVDYTANRHGVISVKTGSKEEAWNQYVADKRYLDVYYYTIRAATR